MKKSSPFTVQKIKKYRKAHYGSESGVNLIGHAVWLSWRFSQQVVKGAVALLLFAGVSMGAISCEEAEVISDGDRENEATTNCVENDYKCPTEWTIETCDTETGKFKQAINCEDYCIDENGPDYYSSYGCDINKKDDPCNCRYAVVDGDIGDCETGETRCDENGNLNTCNKINHGWESYTGCSEICANKDPNLVSKGCDETNTDNPCLCSEDQSCKQNEVKCTAYSTIRSCNTETGIFNDHKMCSDYCSEIYGSEYKSSGACSETRNNPCYCVYEFDNVFLCSLDGLEIGEQLCIGKTEILLCKSLNQDDLYGEPQSVRYRTICANYCKTLPGYENIDETIPVNCDPEDKNQDGELCECYSVADGGMVEDGDL